MGGPALWEGLARVSPRVSAMHSVKCGSELGMGRGVAFPLSSGALTPVAGVEVPPSGAALPPAGRALTPLDGLGGLCGAASSSTVRRPCQRLASPWPCSRSCWECREGPPAGFPQQDDTSGYGCPAVVDRPETDHGLWTQVLVWMEVSVWTPA